MPPPPPAQAGTPGPPPSPSLQGLAGQGQPQPGGGDQSIQLVTQHLMQAEQELQAAARIKPELSAILEKFSNEVKPMAGQILFGQGQGQGGQQPPGGSPPGNPSMGGLMASGASPALSMRP